MNRTSEIIERPSPNFDARPDGKAPDMLILHYTGMESAEESLARLVDPVAEVSSHYLIDEEGRMYRLVDEEMRAWHAGVAHWAGEDDINGCSIGIELQNPGHEFGYREFPEAQMQALATLAQDIMARHNIPAHRVLGHSDVAPGRKQDPGELFDWPWLAGQGIGLWSGVGLISDEEIMTSDKSAVTAFQKSFCEFGYGVPVSGEYCAETRAVVSAFQRHWRPKVVTGEIDRETLAILADLTATT